MDRFTIGHSGECRSIRRKPWQCFGVKITELCYKTGKSVHGSQTNFVWPQTQSLILDS